jgi:SAM-dependent methyltransferase
MIKKFEEVGWSRIDISTSAQLRVERTLKLADVRIESIDISNIVTGYQAFKCLREYESEYKTYAGPLEHCFLEKSLEHYLSLLLIKPKTGMIGVDIGSCQSVLPSLGRRVYGVRYFEQDLEYPAGVHGDRIGGSADAIPLPDHSVDFMTLHCTFEHFENDADTSFIKECARLLKKRGKTIILPLYLSESYCNVTGEADSEKQTKIGFDKEADYYCLIPEWKNRFGRHYSPQAFIERVWRPAIANGLNPCLYKINIWPAIHKDLWLRWALVIER